MWGPRGSAQHPTAHRTAQGRRARGSGLVEAGCPPTCAQRPIPVACCFHSGSELSGWRKCFQPLADSWLWRDPWVPWGEMGDTPPHSEIQVPTPVASGCASRVPCPQAQKVQSVELITSCGARPGGRTWRDFQVQAPASPLWRVLLVPSPLRAGSGPRCTGSGLVPVRWHFHIAGRGPRGASPPSRLAHTRKTSGRHCVFILLSINGMFSNGEWEMDLVFKKKMWILTTKPSGNTFRRRVLSHVSYRPSVRC